MVKLTLLGRMAVSHNLTDLKGMFMNQVIVAAGNIGAGLLGLIYQALVEVGHDPVVRIYESNPFSPGFPYSDILGSTLMAVPVRMNGSEAVRILGLIFLKDT